MTLELFSTSAPAGLEPGSTGYCTVAMTRGLPRALAGLLESLSAYRPVFMPGDPREGDNPVVWSHLRLSAGGRGYAIVSRTCFSGLDHTRRTNRFAHHVVLDGNDPRPIGGPAWLAMQPGFLEHAWDGEVCWLGAGRPLLNGDSSVQGCPSWAYLTGDPGWAGVVLEKLNEGQTFYLVYDPGVDILPLIAEAIHLLPPERRWSVTFTTYFTGLPQGVGCQLRGVVRGSPEAQAAPRGATLDLAAMRAGPAPDSAWVEVARGLRRVDSMPVLAPTSMPYRPVEITPASAEGELYIPDGPVWREGLSAPRPAPMLMHPGSPVLVPIPPPHDEVHREEEQEQVKKRVGLGVMMGVLIGLIMVAGVSALAFVGWQVLDSTRGKDKDKHVVVGNDKDMSIKERDKSIGSGVDKTGGKAKVNDKKLEINLPKEVGAGTPFEISVWVDPIPPKDEKFPWDKVTFTENGADLPATPIPTDEDKREFMKFRVTRPLDNASYTVPRNVKITASLAGYESAAKEVVVKAREKEPFPPFQVVATKKEFGRNEPVVVEIRWKDGKSPDPPVNWGRFRFVIDKPPPQKPKAPGRDGRFSLGTLPPHRQPYVIKAVYEGDEKFQRTESRNETQARVLFWPVKVTVKPAELHRPEKGNVTIDVTVASPENKEEDPIPTGEVHLLDEDGKTVLGKARVDRETGTASLVWKQPKPRERKYELTAVYVPDSKSEYEAGHSSVPPILVKGTPVVAPTPPVVMPTYLRIRKGTKLKGNTLEVTHESSAAPFTRLEELDGKKSYTIRLQPPKKDASGELLATPRAETGKKTIEHRKESLELQRNSQLIEVRWTPLSAELKPLEKKRPKVVTVVFGQDKAGTWFLAYELHSYVMEGQEAETIERLLVPGFKKALDSLDKWVLEIFEKGKEKTPVLRYTIDMAPVRD